MRTSEVVGRIENLQKEASVLLDCLKIEGTPHAELLEKLDRIHSAIEELESEIGPANSNELQGSRTITDEVKTKKAKLLKLVAYLKRLLSSSLDIGGFPAVDLLSTLISLLEGSESVMLSDAIRCVSIAERPDFSPLQLVRRCKFEIQQDGPIPASSINHILAMAHQFSVSEQTCTGIKLESRNGALFSYSTEPSNTIPSIGIDLMFLGFMNKLEQLFSPTSSINNIARVCYNIAGSLLGDHIVLSSQSGDTTWADFAYPQFKKSLSIKTVVSEAMKMSISEYKKNTVSVKCESDEIVSGLSTLGLFIILQGLSLDPKISIESVSRNEVKISHELNHHTEPYLAGASQFVTGRVEQHDRFILIAL